MKRLHLLILSASLMVCSFASAKAQGVQPPQARPTPTGFALEVTFVKENAPAYQAVPAAEAKMIGAWYAGFRQASAWQSTDGLKVLAVNVISHVEGDGVRINVSVYLGKRFFDKEQTVANYLAHENEKRTIDELTEFGVEPFEIKMVRVEPSAPDPPPVISQASSIQIVNIENNRSTLPSYKLTLRNLSAKNVRALEIRIMAGGKINLVGQRRDAEDKTLIAPGSVYEIIEPGAERTRRTMDGFEPDIPPEQQIVIATAVFEDGSYEGDALPAARIIAMLRGRRIQLARLVELMQKALAAPDLNSTAALENFKAQVSSLDDEVEQSALDQLAADFPALSENEKKGFSTAFQVSMHRLRTSLLDDLKEVEKTQGLKPDSDAFRLWLAENKERYERWLARL